MSDLMQDKDTPENTDPEASPERLLSTQHLTKVRVRVTFSAPEGETPLVRYFDFPTQPTAADFIAEIDPHARTQGSPKQVLGRRAMKLKVDPSFLKAHTYVVDTVPLPEKARNDKPARLQRASAGRPSAGTQRPDPASSARGPAGPDDGRLRNLGNLLSKPARGVEQGAGETEDGDEVED